MDKPVQWEEYISKQDMKWEKMPTCWEEGAFLGNGIIGTMIFQDEGDLLFKLGRSDVIDKELGCRVQIGEIRANFSSDISKGTARLDLWNGRWISNFETTANDKVSITSYVSADPNVIVVEIEGDTDVNLSFQPDIAMTTRVFIPWTNMKVPYKNPNPQIGCRGGINYCYQKLRCGYQYVTGWTSTKVDNKTIIYISIAYGDSKDGIFNEVINNINNAIDTSISCIRESISKFYNDYYQKSYLSIPDKNLESFYWVQLYKFASGTRENTIPLDLMGPWTAITAWAGMWWNLNMQLTYWPILASNHLELAKPVRKALIDNIPNLKLNVPEEYRDEETMAIPCVTTNTDFRGPVGDERCDLIWACHNYWLIYRHSMDEKILRDELYPLLRGALNFYLKLLYEEDGVYHMPLGSSPEYSLKAEDCNIDLALIRWGCDTLIQICDILNIDDQMNEKWHDVLERLVEYPIEDNKLMIGKDVPYAISHRHYSHLLGIYPLYLINYEQEENKQLIKQSLEHWLSKSEAFRGYSLTGASSIYSSMRDGNKAYEYLNRFICDVSKTRKGCLTPNTFYKEGSPVIETPFSAVKSLQDMLIQSWGDKIRIFPAIPDEWKDIEIKDFLVEGAFLVSAIMKQRTLTYIKVESQKGGVLRIENTFNINYKVSQNNKIITEVDSEVLEIDTKPGDKITIKRK